MKPLFISEDWLCGSIDVRSPQMRVQTVLDLDLDRSTHGSWREAWQEDGH